MGRLGNFLRLPPSERRLVIRVTFLLGATQLALRMLSFRRVYRWMENAGRKRGENRENQRLSADLICSVVNRSGRRFLGVDSCFPQALVGEMLLERNGYPSTLRIGVIKSQAGELKAHAWVEKDGEVVIGGPVSHVERYTPLPELDKIKL